MEEETVMMPTLTPGRQSALELPDPDRLNEDDPAPDVNEDDNLEVVPPDVLDA